MVFPLTTYISSVEKKWLGFIALDRKPMHLRLSNGCRARASLNVDSKSIEIPRQWYNLIADLPVKPPPPLHPKTFEPIKPEDLSPLFPDELIKQEASSERFIDIPDEVRDVYKLWRPSPLIRFVELACLTTSFFLLTYSSCKIVGSVLSFQLYIGPRGWRSFLTHPPEFTTSMKVSARLDHTSPTLQFHKCGIMHKKESRRS